MHSAPLVLTQALRPAHIARPLAQRLLLPVVFLFVVLSLLASQRAQASVSQSVRLPNQEYTESSEDLKVKVLGGHVRINRSWTAGKWYLNPAWANLRFEPDPLGGVLAIDRSGSMYKRTAGGTGTDIYAFGPNNFIARQDNGWRWYDRKGNSIDYDAEGRIQSYADLAGITVRFTYDDKGVLNSVLDHHNQPALLIQTDSQGRVTQVSDAREPNRKVQYRWTGSGSSSQLETVTDLLGNDWTYTYNGNGYITQRKDPLGATIELTYMSNPSNTPGSPGFAGMGAGDSSQAGNGAPLDGPSIGSTKVTGPNIARVASYTDESGATTNYRVEWDRTRQQYTLHIQEPSGLERTTVYDKDGRVVRTRAAGIVDRVRSVDSKTQERITDARGLVTTYQYNANRQPVKIIYPDGSHESYTYDSHGRTTQHTNALGVISAWTYDKQGNTTHYIEAKGLSEQRTTLSTYDSYGQLTEQRIGAGDGTDTDAISHRYTYDEYGNRSQYINPLGHNTRSTYNSQGLALSQTDALGQVTRLTYDTAGNRLSVTSALNETETQVFDARDRVVKVISAEGLERTIRYDSAGRVIEILVPGQTEGQGLRTGYDQAGRPVQTISPSGLISQTEFDQLGRISQTIDPAGNITRYEYGAPDSPLADLLTAIHYPTYKATYQYDQRGRQTGVVLHLGNDQTLTYRQAYNALGQAVSSTDPAGKTTLSQYDALGRLIQTTDAMAQITRQTWDAHNNLLSLTDAAGNTHQFSYNEAGQQLKEIRPLGGTIQYTYDELGQLIKRIDAGGNTREYTYDAIGQLTEEEHKLAGSTRDQHIRYQYNKDGQLTGYEQTDGSNQLISSAQYSLDAQGRTASSQVTYGKTGTADSVSFTVGQSFNADGQLASHTYPDGSQQRYHYQQGYLSKVALPNDSEINYGDYHWLVPQQITMPGASKTLMLDALLRPTAITVKNQQAKILAERLYQYDTVGNISQIKSDLGSTDYGYDKLDRLTQANPDLALQTLGLLQELYSYDAVGNRTASVHQPGSWTYNADNQLTQYPDLQPFSFGAQPIDTQVSYTPQGHTLQEISRLSQKDYRYNAAERLIHLSHTLAGQTTPNLEADYRYDPFGRRISKTITQGANTRTTWFIYSKQGLMAEANEQGELTKAYGFNPIAGQQGLWSTDPLWQANVVNNQLSNDATAYHYLHTDHLYTPMLATDKEGSISWKSVQESSGAVGVQQHQSRISMNLRFPGQYYDWEAGTHYNYQRDYKPNQGRYIQSDPIGLAGGNNFYAYAQLEPINRKDPTGLVTWKGAYGLASGGAAAGRGKGKLVSAGYLIGHAVLQTECVGNEKGIVSIMFDGIIADIGKGLLGPFTLETSVLECEAPMDYKAFAGPFDMQSMGTIFASLTWMTLGVASCTAHGWQISTDLAVFSGTTRGQSRVLGGKIETCCD